MRYSSRAEAEGIGWAGAHWEEDEHGIKCRMMDSFWLYCEPNDTAFTPHAKTDGFWESWVLTWLSQNVDFDGDFIDVGANVGFYSFWAAVNGCRVLAFEPNPDLIVLMEASMKANDLHIEIEDIALADKPGWADFWVPAGHSGAGGIYTSTPEGEKMVVYTSTFDEMYRIDAPTMMKIDAEGAEPLIWAGMQTAWSTGLVTVVMEWQKDRYDAEAFADELFSKARVSVINHRGGDDPLTKDQLLKRNDIEMLVLKP